jgi:hypothetical protein
MESNNGGKAFDTPFPMWQLAAIQIFNCMCAVMDAPTKEDDYAQGRMGR